MLIFILAYTVWLIKYVNYVIIIEIAFAIVSFLEVDNMKFYDGISIDKAGRICLSGYIEPGNTYVICVEDERVDLVYIEPYTDQPVPEKCRRKCDMKGRIALSKYFRREAKSAFVCKDESGRVVLRLVEA